MEVNTDSSIKDDEFMKVFKYYKSNKHKPSINDVISMENCDNVEVTKVPYDIIEDSRTELLGLKSFKHWQLYTFRKHPGLFCIKNPFTELGQRYWIRKCLEEYPRKPNRLNIDIECSLHDWWAECFTDEICDKILMKKLRWTTLGYHHNWDTKVYSEDNKSPFPSDLAELSDLMATYLGYQDFRAEAAIVNYYHMKSTLSAHTDHSEVNLEAPLFSFSFGQSAIFLIGGIDKSIVPSALLINSGDVIVMSKEARLCYHAVPKILLSSNSYWDNPVQIKVNSDIPNLKYISQPKKVASLMNANVENQEWDKFRNYIQESRINMNVRQVLNKKQKSL